MGALQRIKELRARTGVGIADCKKAIENTETMEEAIQWLKEKGISKGAAKSSVVALEGVVVLLRPENGVAALVEVNCQTDFVARNVSFVETAKKVAMELRSKKITTPTEELEKFLNQETFRLGEKVSIGKTSLIELSEGQVAGAYLHNDDQKGAIVVFENVEQEIADAIALHVVAMKPLFALRESISSEYVENERKAHRKQLIEEGKPEQIIDRIVEGKLRKMYSEVVLIEQEYALAEEKGQTIRKMVGDGKIVSMTRFEVGERS